SGPLCIVLAGVVGLAADLDPSAVNGDSELLARLESIRLAAGAILGRSSPSIPRLALIGPVRYRSEGAPLNPLEEHDLVARAISMRRMHHALPMTVLHALAVAACIPGTLAAACTSDPTRRTVRVAHAKGVSEATVAMHESEGGEPEVASVAIVRTARRLLEGRAFLRW